MNEKDTRKRVSLRCESFQKRIGSQLEYLQLRRVLAGLHRSTTDLLALYDGMS